MGWAVFSFSYVLIMAGLAFGGAMTLIGFGGLLVFGFDYVDNPNAWQTSLRMLAEQVAPRIRHLTPA